MIDSKLISIIDLKESNQILDIYSNKLFTLLFSFFYTINQYEFKYFSIEFISKIIYFLQFIFISIIWYPIEEIKSDYLMNFINQLKKFLFVQNIVDNKTKFIIALCFCFCFSFCLIILVITIIINTNKGQSTKNIIVFYNYINLFYINYFYCFQINIMLLPINCKNKKMIFLELDCYKSISHLLLVFLCLLIIILSVGHLFLVSKFTGKTENMKNINIYSRISSNYELYVSIFCTLFYFYGHFIVLYGKEYSSLLIIIRICFMIGSFLISFYIYSKVYFLNEKMNILHFCGWTFSMWFFLSISIKVIFSLNQIFFFVIIGWALIFNIVYFYRKLLSEQLLNKNIFDTLSIKDIEIFVQNIFNIMKNNQEKKQIFLIGLINSFEDYFNDKPELNSVFERFMGNKILKEKYGNENLILKVYGIIYTLLNSIKDKLRDDGVLLFCSFLINKIKNYNLALYLCSKHRVNGFYNYYIKYCLIENSKNMMKEKLDDSDLDDINKFQIGNVLLFFKECDNLKIKIYDATCNQYDYFETLKTNDNLKEKTHSQFLEIGITLVNLRKEILNNWNRIILLNPFNEEIKNDFMLYLVDVIEDSDMANDEEIKYNNYKHLQLNDKNKLYYTLFDENITSILLIDCKNNNKIKYVTSNFYILFNYSKNDINYLTINDLIPKCISIFHKEMIKEALNYSNLNEIFKTLKNILLKGKNNEIYNVNGYFKLLPDLSYGPLYIGMVQKIKERNFLIVLNQEFNIDSMSIPYYCSEFDSLIQNYPFELNNNIIGHNISLIIPSILTLLKFQDSKFVIEQINLDFKGHLYSNKNNGCLTNKIEVILKKIKQGEKISLEFENKNSFSKNHSQNNLKNKLNDIINDYLDLIEEYNKISKKNFYYISYRITKHSFLNEKFYYYRINIDRDIFEEYVIQQKTNFKIKRSSTLFQTFNNQFKMIDLHEKKQKLIIPIHNYKMSSSKTLKNEKKVKKKKKLNNSKKKAENNLIKEEQQLNSSIESKIARKYYNNIQFKKMKEKFLKNKNPYYISVMKILSFLFSSLSMFFIIKNNNSMISKFKSINYYLDQNYVFNHTKTALSNIYYASINLKLLKYNIMGNNGCIGQYYCIQDYSDIILRGNKILKRMVTRILKFDKDYKVIMESEINFDIYSNNLDNKTNFHGSVVNLIYIVMIMAKKLSSNAYDYVYGNQTELDVYLENIMNYYIMYLKLEEANGLNDFNKRKNAKQPKYLSNKFYMTINIVFLY